MTRFVDKIRASVHVAQPGCGPRAGFFSLSVRSANHPGPETLLELLNSPRAVLPFHRAEDRGISLLTRLAIDAVHVDPTVDPALVAPPTFCFTREERVIMVFHDGAAIEGLLRMELPHDMNRASDFLNGPDDFCALAAGGNLVLVNRTRVREIRLFQPSPRPLDAAPASLGLGDTTATGD